MGKKSKMPFNGETLWIWADGLKIIKVLPKVDSGLCTKRIRVYSRSQVSVYRNIGPLVYSCSHKFDSSLVLAPQNIGPLLQ